MNTQQARPVPLTERADILDVLRGFALLGVMLDNLAGFTGWGFLSQQEKESLSTWPADGLLGLLELTFIKGKFYSLFSLLFGIGFSVFLTRSEQKGINPLRIFYRRLFILMLFGIAHLFLLWEGDILLLYALIGLFLPLFRKCSDKTLVITAIALIASPILIDVVKVLLGVRTGAFLQTIGESIDKKSDVPPEDFSQYLYKEGSGWKEWRIWQRSGFFWRYSDLIESNRIPKVLGMFLFGFYAGRKMMYMQLENYVRLFKWLRRWGFIVGIPAAMACTYFEIFQAHVPKPVGLFSTFFYAISVVPLCLAYVSVICLRWIKKQNDIPKIAGQSVSQVKTKLKWLTPLGRMALTNYLMQTILGITIYYGVGFGLGGNIGPVLYIPIGLAVYAFQIIYSTIWLKYFNYGPFEWIWRMLTYGKRLKILKNK